MVCICIIKYILQKREVQFTGKAGLQSVKYRRNFLYLTILYLQYSLRFYSQGV